MSFGSDQPADLATTVRTLRIIVFALLMGVVSFGVVAVLKRPEPPEDTPLLPLLGVGMAVGSAVLSVVVGQVLARVQSAAIAAGRTLDDQLDDPDADELQLLGVLQTKVIVECALLEGAAFLNLVGYMLHGTLYSLGVTVLLLLGIALRFPRTSSVRVWLDDRLRDIRDQRAA